MADRREQHFEVAPTRIGGSAGSGRPGRRRRVPIALIIAVAVAIPAIAWMGPRIEWRPEVDLSFLRPTPTPAPSRTPRALFQSTSIPATPLPDVTVVAGEHPTQPFPIDVDGLRLVDPATGQLGQAMELRLDTDAVFAAADGNGWWCVCFNRVQTSDSETVGVEIRRVDSTGRTTSRQTISEYKSTAMPPASDFYNRFDLELAADGRTAYLASATRSGNDWSVAVETIDLVEGALTGHLDLGNLDATPLAGPSPPPDQGINDSYLAGPLIRLSPDGRRLLAWAWVDRYTWNGEQGSSTPMAWTIDLDVGGEAVALGRPTAFAEAAADRLRQCVWAAWTAPDEITAICWPRDQGTLNLGASILRADLSEVRRTDITGTLEAWFTDPILDLANRAIYLWQPAAHILHRLDIDGGRTDRVEVDPDSTFGGSDGAGPGGVTSRKQPQWATLGSDLRLWSMPQLIGEPCGGRLFALGSRENRRGDGSGIASTGIWVFDAREFTVVDHWAPLTSYTGLGLSDDGRWLLASGVPGADADGNPATWQASLTILDAADGRPALQLGSLGTNYQVLQLPR
jgi:hypothetical protein